MEMGGILLRRIDAAIVSSASIKLFKSTNRALSGGNSSGRPVGKN